MNTVFHVDVPSPYNIRRIAPGDGKRLLHFYRELSAASRRRLTPLGLKIDRQTCELICFDNWLQPADKYDLVLTLDELVVGWCFIWGVQGPQPNLGIAIAEAHQRNGLGRMMMSAILTWASEQKLLPIQLTVEADNVAALRVYELFGFTEQSNLNESPGLLHMIKSQ